MDSQVSRASMVTFCFVSEFSGCSKISSRADPRPCAAPEAPTAPPAPDLVLATLLVFVLAREATASFFSLFLLLRSPCHLELHKVGCWRRCQCFGSSTEGGGLLYSEFYYILKIRLQSRRLPFLPWTPQSLVKQSKAQTVSPLPPVRL